MRTASLVLLLLAAGCATVGSVSSRPLGDGTGRSFTASLPDTRAALRIAFDSTGMGLKDSAQINDSTLDDRRQPGRVGVSYGEVVRVVLVGRQDATDVLASAKRLATTVFATSDWSTKLFKYMSAALADSGRRIVDAAPPALSQGPATQ